MIKARIVDRIERRNFCGMSGTSEFYQTDNPRVGIVPVADFRRPVSIGDEVEFEYVATGNGYRWLPI